MSSITNSYGIQIKICCASCVNCQLISTDSHRCKIKKEETLPHFSCIAWEVKPKLMNAGMGTGKIRSKQEIIKAQEKRVEKGILRINYSEDKRQSINNSPNPD